MAPRPSRAPRGTEPILDPAAGLHPEIQDILALRSRDPGRTLAVLRRERTPPRTLVPYVIPLLAWDAVSDAAIRALRTVADKHIGAFADALLDPGEDFAVRRRVARVMAACTSQRAVESLLAGLGDSRFEVRYQCGRSLAAIIARQPRLRIDHAWVVDVVRQEVAVSRPVWGGRRRLDGSDEGEFIPLVEDPVRGRVSRSLTHVFTLLSLVLPGEPLQIALRGLHTDDQNLRGTSLEYLESVLPPEIRGLLWPFLEDDAGVRRSARPREEVVADLLRSHQSIEMRPQGT